MADSHYGEATHFVNGDLLTFEQAAAKHRVSVETISDLSAAGMMTLQFSEGGVRFVHPPDLVDFLRQIAIAKGQTNRLDFESYQKIRSDRAEKNRAKRKKQKK